LLRKIRDGSEEKDSAEQNRIFFLNSIDKMNCANDMYMFCSGMVVVFVDIPFIFNILNIIGVALKKLLLIVQLFLIWLLAH
jgi:hypothetical protein